MALSSYICTLVISDSSVDVVTSYQPFRSSCKSRVLIQAVLFNRTRLLGFLAVFVPFPLLSGDENFRTFTLFVAASGVLSPGRSELLCRVCFLVILDPTDDQYGLPKPCCLVALTSNCAAVMGLCISFLVQLAFSVLLEASLRSVSAGC